MTHIDTHPSDPASLALATYLEPLLRGRRVLLVASPESSLTAHFASLADAVQVVPADELSIVGSHADAELELVFDEDDFDLIWVTEVSELPDPRARAMDAFANALSRDGALVLCTRAGEQSRPKRRRGGKPTDALRKLASQVCEEVLVLSESAFDGFDIDAPDAPDEGTALDQSLVRRQDVAPGWYVAVGADRLPALETRLVVRVPDAGRVAQVDDGRVAELEARLEKLTAEADGLRGEAAELDEALERALVRAERAEKGAAVIERELDDLVRRRRQDRDDLDHARVRIRKLERELEKAREQAPDPEELEALREETGELEARLVETGAKVVELEAEVERRGEIARDLMVDLEHARDELAQAAIPSAPAAESADSTVIAADLPGSALLGRDSERVRAMGAELLTYRQHASERDALLGQLEEAQKALRVERAHAKGLQMRLDEAELALEPVDGDGASSDELAELHEAMDGSEARVRELSRNLAQAQTQVVELQREATRISEEDAANVPEREALARQLAEAQQRASDLEQALRESDDTLDALRRDLESREAGLEQTRRERDEARAGLAEARALLQQVASLSDG